MEQEEKRRSGAHLFGASLVAAALGGIIGVIYFHKALDQNLYSWEFFCGLPAFTGFVGVSILGVENPATVKEACLIGLYNYLIVAVALLICVWEGVLCIAMAAPVAIGFGVLGALLGSALYNWIHEKYIFPTTLCVLPIVPLALVYATFDNPGPDVRTESTEIVVSAPPERIWPLLFNLDHVDTPLWTPFAEGIAYPIRTHSEGALVGSRRECILSTGTMHERISILEPNRRFRFDVLDTPPTMTEMNPFGHIEPPHLRGYYHCRYGEFRMEPLSGGRTRLIGISSYDQELYPGWYWGLLSDSVVEHVHQRVMLEIKRRVETR